MHGVPSHGTKPGCSNAAGPQFAVRNTSAPSVTALAYFMQALVLSSRHAAVGQHGRTEADGTAERAGVNSMQSPQPFQANPHCEPALDLPTQVRTQVRKQSSAVAFDSQLRRSSLSCPMSACTDKSGIDVHCIFYPQTRPFAEMPFAASSANRNEVSSRAFHAHHDHFSSKPIHGHAREHNSISHELT